VPAGGKVTGVPAIEHRRWLRAAAGFSEIPDLIKTVRKLQKHIEMLESQQAETAADLRSRMLRQGGRLAETAASDTPAERTAAATMDTTEISNIQGIDIQGILKLLPHRYPFLMIDRVLEVEPGVRAVGVKCVSANEPYFQGHFPDHPIMPGVMLTEAFAQMAGIIAMTAHPDFSGKAVYLMGLDKVRFRRPVVPGDRVVITCEKLFERRGVWKFTARAEVDGVKVADGQVMATVVDKPV